MNQAALLNKLSFAEAKAIGRDLVAAFERQGLLSRPTRRQRGTCVKQGGTGIKRSDFPRTEDGSRRYRAAINDFYRKATRKLRWVGQPCDCGTPAVHWFNGPECQSCWDKRLMNEKDSRPYVRQ